MTNGILVSGDTTNNSPHRIAIVVKRRFEIVINVLILKSNFEKIHNEKNIVDSYLEGL